MVEIIWAVAGLVGSLWGAYKKGVDGAIERGALFTIVAMLVTFVGYEISENVRAVGNVVNAWLGIQIS